MELYTVYIKILKRCNRCNEIPYVGFPTLTLILTKFMHVLFIYLFFKLPL